MHNTIFHKKIQFTNKECYYLSEKQEEIVKTFIAKLLCKVPIKFLKYRSLKYKVNEMIELNFTLRDLMLDLIDKRRKIENFRRYEEIGIERAKRYFILDNRSNRYSFKETFVDRQYSFFDYRNKIVVYVLA